MKILLTGATGYIGKRLLPVLLSQGHQVICCVRDKQRFATPLINHAGLSVIEVDFLDENTLSAIPSDLDVAYYLIHSMSASIERFDSLEKESATNFRDSLQNTQVKQVIYLSGITNTNELSKHLSSRRAVEETLSKGSFALTTLRAGIIVGSGSASFEIIRDLVEKLPIMIAPKWLKTKSQPIAIRNVLQFLQGVILDEYTYNKSFDIGGPEVLTYKDMLLRFAQVRKLKRTIIDVPVLSPKLSSYWLYFITSTSYKLAANLVDSMKIEIICEPNDLRDKLNINLLTYEEAVQMAFTKIEQQEVLSHWTDAQSGDALLNGIDKLIKVPEFGCVEDKRMQLITNEKETINKIWRIGGHTGWYYANWLWNVRGFLDKVVGGVGLRRGRKSPNEIYAGDSLDFWRVIYANKDEKRLLLYAEMKLPGEAWLEFKIQNDQLIQTATFRPLGILGRFYWYAMLPFHEVIFGGMVKKIASA